MVIDITNIVDFIKYTRYPERTAVAILLNDALNLHIREDNMLSYSQTKIDGEPAIRVVLDPDLRTKIDGKDYVGDVTLIYEKIDASIVFPNGFYTHVQESGEFTITSALEYLRENTRIQINQGDYEVVEDQDGRRIQFLDTAMFWKGEIALGSMDEIIHDEITMDELLFFKDLDGLHILPPPVFDLGEGLGKDRLLGFEQKHRPNSRHLPTLLKWRDLDGLWISRNLEVLLPDDSLDGFDTTVQEHLELYLRGRDQLKGFSNPMVLDLSTRLTGDSMKGFWQRPLDLDDLIEDKLDGFSKD